MKVLEINNLTKRIKKKKIIDDLSIEINSGEIVGFLGPNGAGKTTTIKMITGLLSYKEGCIKICDIDVKENFVDAIKNVGAIIENPELYSYLSGKDNLKVLCSQYGEISDERFEETIEFVKLGNRIDDKVKNYSLGMRQRLGLAQAIIHKPKLLILDEPTNGLDPQGIKDLRECLKKMAQEDNVGIIVSSHLLSEMEQMCDRIIVIQNGKYVASKNLKDFNANNDKLMKYKYIVSDIQKAIRILKEKYEIEVNSDSFYIKCSLNNIYAINKLLFENDINISSLTKELMTLEEEFLSIIENKEQIK